MKQQFQFDNQSNQPLTFSASPKTLACPLNTRHLPRTRLLWTHWHLCGTIKIIGMLQYCSARSSFLEIRVSENGSWKPLNAQHLILSRFRRCGADISTILCPRPPLLTQGCRCWLTLMRSTHIDSILGMTPFSCIQALCTGGSVNGWHIQKTWYAVYRYIHIYTWIIVHYTPSFKSAWRTCKNQPFPIHTRHSAPVPKRFCWGFRWHLSSTHSRRRRQNLSATPAAFSGFQNISMEVQQVGIQAKTGAINSQGIGVSQHLGVLKIQQFHWFFYQKKKTAMFFWISRDQNFSSTTTTFPRSQLLTVTLDSLQWFEPWNCRFWVNYIPPKTNIARAWKDAKGHERIGRFVLEQCET